MAVNNLARSNPLSEITKRLKFTYGLEVSELILREHFQRFSIIPIESTQEVSINQKTPINLDELTLAQWNLNIAEPERVVRYLQEKLLCLSLRQVQVVAQEQADYLSGESPLLNKDQVQNLRILLNLADRFTAISLQANQQQAVRIVQNLGYTDEDLKSLPQQSQ